MLSILYYKALDWYTVIQIVKPLHLLIPGRKLLPRLERRRKPLGFHTKHSRKSLTLNLVNSGKFRLAMHYVEQNNPVLYILNDVWILCREHYFTDQTYIMLGKILTNHINMLAIALQKQMAKPLGKFTLRCCFRRKDEVTQCRIIAYQAKITILLHPGAHWKDKLIFERSKFSFSSLTNIEELVIGANYNLVRQCIHE